MKDYPEEKKFEPKDVLRRNDPVIHEIPVFVAKSLAQKLFTVQVSYK